MPFLPIFPLKLVVFPEERLNLHIFEPRYQELVADGLSFGIPLYSDNTMMDIGTEVNVLQIANRHPTGESDIKTVGARRFHILRFYRRAPGRSYGGAEIEFLNNEALAPPAMTAGVAALGKALYDLLDIAYPDWLDEEEFYSFEAGHHLGLSQGQEYEMLCMDKESERLTFLKRHLEAFIPHLQEMRRLQERIQMNGHFKHLDPLDWKWK